MIEDIAKKVLATRFEDLSSAARERLLLCTLANISVGVAGARYALVPEPVDAGGRFRLLSGARAREARRAAFWNGAAMHARTQDDFHPNGNLHTATLILPALLAVADETDIAGTEFLSALAAGYMVAIGLSRSHSELTTPRGLRSTCIYAPFGATATVVRARRLALDKAMSALALTTAFNAGNTQTWVDGSDEWQVHAGNGAEAGIATAELAAAGVKGGARALDGPAGFFRSVVGKEMTWAGISGDFDASRAIEETSIKRYPVSGICQSITLASERLAGKLAGGSKSIKSVRVEMNPFEMRYPGTLNRGPFRSFSDRLMSAAFCAGSVLARGGFTFVDFHAGPDPERDRIIALSEVVDDKALPLLSGRVSIETSDGRRMSEHVANSRGEVGIDWASVDAWAEPLWAEAGRDAGAYRRCREAVLELPKTRAARLPF